MTGEGFRKMALDLPLATEGEHMGHPDFRVGGKIFATLPPLKPAGKWGMVRLPPAEQRRLVGAKPEAFEPAKGAWGKQGCTYVRLAEVDRATLRGALEAAWRGVAPRKLIEELERDASG